MANKKQVDALMSSQGVSRTMANNMLRTRKKIKGSTTPKRKSVAKPTAMDAAEYRKHRKEIIGKRYKTTKTVRKHRTSRIKTDTKAAVSKKK